MNKWLWTKLQNLPYKGGYAFAKYAPHGTIPLVPFVPSQQLPEFTDIAGGAPFIVYTYSINNSGLQWFVRDEQVAYVIYDNDEERLRTIHTYMVDLLCRMEWTAQEINDYLQMGAGEPGTSGDLFDFKTVSVFAGNGPQPFESEGGRQGAMIVCRLSYTHDLVSDPTVTNGLGMRI